MKNQLVCAPFTTRRCLFGDADAVAAIEKSFERRSVRRSVGATFRRLGGAGRRAVSHQAATAANDLLDVDLADVTIGGLRASARLRNAARRSLVDGEPHTVVIASYQVKCAHRPSVAVLVDELEVARIHLSLDFQITIDGLAGTVTHGALTALGGDRCTIKATLSVHGKKVAERSVDVPLAAVVTLRDPVPLLSEAERLRATAPGTQAAA